MKNKRWINKIKKYKIEWMSQVRVGNLKNECINEWNDDVGGWQV